MGNLRLKGFGEYLLSESLTRMIKEESNSASSKAESYRSIAYKLVQIFRLYGFFFAQKPGVLDPSNWTRMMQDLASTPDLDQKWSRIIDLCKKLQEKLSSPSMNPTQRGEFGYRGQYSYSDETEGLPRAAEYLKTASDAALSTFTSEEKQKAVDILDSTLLAIKPLSVYNIDESLFVTEKQQYLPPTNTDLLRRADSIGTRLLRIYDEMESLKSSFPESESEVESFLTGVVIPAAEEIKSMVQTDIPNVGSQAAEGYMKKLDSFDQKVDEISRKYQAIRDRITQTFRPNIATKAYEDSAQKIIDEVKQGIRNQGIQNARWKKTGDVIAGTTDITSPEEMRDAQISSSAKTKAIQKMREKQKAQDLSRYLSKKYSQ